MCAFLVRPPVQDFENGLRPAGDEHLAFRVPLIVNGDYAIDNLHVESIDLHLSFLAQSTLQSASLPEGTPIAGFGITE